jgi:hypothetical protein
MSVNDTSRIVIDNTRVMHQIVASLTDDSRGIIYDCNMFIVQATGYVSRYETLLLVRPNGIFLCHFKL